MRMPSSTHRETESNGASLRPPLRERKKLRTQRTIREEALRLFAARGFDETTVEEIADAAEVSPSTFFRYFPTKEDVLFRDEYDPVVVESLRNQPRTKRPVRAVRDAIKFAFSQMSPEEEEQFLLVYRLAVSTPALRGKLYENMIKSLDLFADTLAEWRGTSPHDPAVRTMVGAVVGVIMEAVTEWTKSQGTKPLGATMDEHLARLEEGLSI
jgi:AcrR family transcriptional regulator